MNLQEKLDALANLRAAPDAIRLQKEALIASILTDEQKTKIAEIEAEYEAPLKVAKDKADKLEKEIKTEALAANVGETLRGSYLMAVWNPAQPKWDEDQLEGMVHLIPQLAKCRTMGKPSITIRKS